MRLLVFIFALVYSTVTLATTTIGFVDVQKILTTVKQGVTVMKTLEKNFNDRKTKLKKDEDQIKKDQEDYKKKSAMMNEASRIKEEREIQAKIFELQNKTMEFQKEINDMEREMKKPIIDKVKVIIEDVSKESGVAMTVEVSTSPIVYAQDKMDITDKVIKIYDEKYK